MCLIVCAWRADPRFELLLAANRDEFHARPTTPADRLTDAPAVIGGRDLEAGGGWLQWSTGNRLAAVTNVRVGLPEGRAPRSRGSLVSDFVRGSDDVVTALEALADQAGDFGRFNLLLWDGAALHHGGNHPRFHHGPLPPGIHAVSNGAIDDRWPKTRRAAALLSGWLDAHGSAGAAGDFSALFDALADRRAAVDHELPDTGIGLDMERWLSPMFISGPTYGTRASTVMALDRKGCWWFEERRFGPAGVDAGQSCFSGQLQTRARFDAPET
jgi:uncharacterized protein with NRDE domain